MGGVCPWDWVGGIYTWGLLGGTGGGTPRPRGILGLRGSWLPLPAGPTLRDILVPEGVVNTVVLPGPPGGGAEESAEAAGEEAGPPGD